MSRRSGWLAVLVAGFLWVATLPTAAAAEYDSSADALIGELTGQLVVLAVAVALVVEVVLLFVVVRYRNSGEARPSGSNPRFLVAWSLAIGVILLFVGIASLQTMVALNQQSNSPPNDAVRVDVVAEQWLWTFEYADTDVTTSNTLVVPVDQPVHLRFTSEDVIHSFHAPALGVKQDVMPGQRNSVTFTPTETGEYRVFCAEYCGVGHSRMLATVRVVDGPEYDDWISEQRENATAT